MKNPNRKKRSYKAGEKMSVPRDRDRLPDPMLHKAPPLLDADGNEIKRKVGRPAGSKDGHERETINRRMMERYRLIGMTPLDVHLATMRKAWNEAEQMERDMELAKVTKEDATLIANRWVKLWDMREIANINAARAAPYIHPRLTAIAFTKPAAKSKIDVSVLTGEERRMLLAAIRRGLIRKDETIDGEAEESEDHGADKT